MNILIFGASWNNRGDESAIRAMIDELRIKCPNVKYRIYFSGMNVSSVPYEDVEIVPRHYRVPRRKIFKRLLYDISVKTGGKINLLPGTNVISKEDNRMAFKKFVEAVKWCDIALSAPGGPNISEIYKSYAVLDHIDIIRHHKKPYAFYAPSMGPFKQYKKRIKKVLKNAEFVYLRESISQGYVKGLYKELETKVTLDSAFQHSVDEKKYEKQLEEYRTLNDYLKQYEKVVGITITDLQWHGIHKGIETEEKISTSFESFIEYLTNKGYGIVFIPQLFGEKKDRDYMARFANKDCFVVDDEHDCYFQQYLISKVFAVVGMRYHSNIFSAKMGTPFVSVAYEQKMKGFAEKVGLSEYCFDIGELSSDVLIKHFEQLEKNYDEYKEKLLDIKEWCKKESYKTTERVIQVIEEKGLDK